MPPIPEDIMHAAMEAYLSLMDDDRYDDHKYGSEHIARAIMAERERCAMVAESHGGRDTDRVSGWGGAVRAQSIADAIRKGSNP